MEDPMEEKELTTTYRLGKGPFAGDLIIIADLPDGRSFSIPIPFANRLLTLSATRLWQ